MSLLYKPRRRFFYERNSFNKQKLQKTRYNKKFKFKNLEFFNKTKVKKLKILMTRKGKNI